MRRTRFGHKFFLNAGRKRRVSTLEALEGRALLTTFYVDNGLLLTADRDSSGGISAGDQVTFGNGQSYQQADLTYDAAPVAGDAGTAFSSISQALASPLVQPGDTIDIAGGTYNEAITIGESIILQGEGNVILQAPVAQKGTGITIDSNPSTVSLADIDVEGFRSALSGSGIGTLNLTDMVLSCGGPTDVFADPLNSLSNVTTLNIVDTSSQPEEVDFNTGPPMGLTPYVQTNSLALTVANVTNLSVTTGGGSDTFNVAPIAKNITIDGGDPTPPAQPGDTLNMWFPTWTGNSLSVTKDNSGYSGTYRFSDGAVVQFSHIETITPGVIVQGYQSFNATEGVDSGKVLVAQFTDPFGNLPLSDYSADIDWTDGTKSSGTISYDATTGVYSVYGDHVYGEPEGGDAPGVPNGAAAQLKITIHRTGSPDTVTYDATAIVTDMPVAGQGTTLQGVAGTPLSGSTADGTVVATFSSNGTDHEDASSLWNRINWGDGASTTGKIVQTDSSGNQFSVLGSHTYTAAGKYTITVTVDDGAEQTVISSTATIAPSPLTANQQFATNAYRDLLGRQIDESGLSFWEGQLNAGLSRAQFLSDIDTSPEYRQDEVTSLFEHYLHRPAEPAALDMGANLLAHGGTDEQIAAIIVSSDEYFALHGDTNDSFLSALFEDALHRPIDPAAQAAFGQSLAAGETRLQIVSIVFGSHEYHADVVQDIYVTLLDRSADSGGDAYWANLLDHGATDEQVMAAIAASGEYFGKTA